MQITNTEIQGTKYVQIYLTEEELQKKETKDLVKKYKQEKYSVAIFVSGKENYPEILEKIIVYDHNTLAVWLKCLPVGFHMKIRTSGRGENYTTKLLDINLLKKEKKPAVL